jgi:hypothetical protein
MGTRGRSPKDGSQPTIFRGKARRVRPVLLSVTLFAYACVEVPPGVHAQFAPAGAAERSNFRPGNHGTAPPVEEPVVKESAKEPADAGPPQEIADGGTS